MFLVTHRPWADIARSYRSLTERNAVFSPMLKLVEQIAASDYSYGLYASTSMATLVITQTPEIDMEKEVLRVTLDAKEGVLIFDCQETFSQLPKYQHWIRKCSPEEGFSQLVAFLRLKRWFVES